MGCAIGLLHEQAAQAWTSDELGRQVSLSRSALHERFVHLAGQRQMQRLTRWRMRRGARLLREGHATVVAIAQGARYESEVALARASYLI